MEKCGLAALLSLADNVFSLETLLEGKVTDECLSMFNIDGSMRKTSKSKILQGFVRNPEKNWNRI